MFSILRLYYQTGCLWQDDLPRGRGFALVRGKMIKSSWLSHQRTS